MVSGNVAQGDWLGDVKLAEKLAPPFAAVPLNPLVNKAMEPDAVGTVRLKMTPWFIFQLPNQ